MEVGTCRLEFKDNLIIKPIFDAHTGAAACDTKKLKDDIDYIINTPDCYTFLGGDFIDGITRVDLRRYMHGVTNREIQDALDDALNIYTREAVKTFKPLVDAGKLLFAIAGNHEISIQKHHSYNIAHEICDRLDIPFMGYSCLYKLLLSKKGTGGTYSYTIYSHHGVGGGKKKGASINTLMDLVTHFDADLYVMGHDHKLIGTKSPRLYLSHSGTPKLLSKDLAFLRAGTYLKTYLDRGRITYSEQAGYPPVHTGGGEVRLSLKHRDKNNKHLDVKVIQ